MKNLKYFPFERNRYFYGKLLGVDDFEAEQRYINDKRRLINRFLHGCGVVCGLNVVPVGDDAVSVEPGMALDFAGREIIVDEPVTRKLTQIEGFSFDGDEGEGNNSYLYLCIEYAEYEKNEVYSVAGSGAGQQAQYNRIAEGCHLYLTGVEPEQENNTYYEERKTLYWGNGVRISQIFPRYARSGSVFDVRVIVENMGQKQPISFRYELALDCLKKDGRHWVKVEFDEKNFEKARRYEIPVTLQANDAAGVCGWAKLREGSFFLSVGGAPVAAQAAVEHTVELTREAVEDVVSRRYLAGAMREVKSKTYHQSIYLAKILLFQAGSTVVIDDIEEMPFAQYLCSGVLSGIRELAAARRQTQILRYLEQGVRQPELGVRQPEQGVWQPERGARQPERDTRKPEQDARQSERHVRQPGKSEEKQGAFTPVQTVSGTEVIELGIGGVRGQKFFTPPITHGLGPGDISIVCAVAGSASGPSSIYYGEPEIFEDPGREVAARTAVKADTANGTFVIGIMLTEPTTAKRVKLYWTAFCDRTEDRGEKAGKTLFLKPDMIYLKLREDYYFEPVFTGVSDRRVIWSVTEEGGGTIDENGMYTAPAVPGIYEIAARSAAYPKLCATAYVVVRDV